MLRERSDAFTIIGMNELEISPSVALELLKRESEVVTPALVHILVQVVWALRPHQLWHRFGQHTPVLLAFFELLLLSFLVLDVGTGAKPSGNLADFITHGHAAS